MALLFLTYKEYYRIKGEYTKLAKQISDGTLLLGDTEYIPVNEP